MPQRWGQPPRKGGHKPPRPPPVYTWKFQSKRGSMGGDVVTYLTRLNRDGSLECDCPGWRFKRKDQPRQCLHVTRAAQEAPEILRAFRAGEKLPELEVPVVREQTEPVYGRTIQL